MLRFPNYAVLTLTVVGFASLAYAAAPRDIGTAVAIKNKVTAADEKAKRPLANRDPVRELETLESVHNSNGEFLLADDTKLALGPDAKLVLDKFVYDPDKTGGKVTVNLAKGAFRFITGKSGVDAYEIKTPNASLGVRGTVFDGFVATGGATAAAAAMVVLPHEGSVKVSTGSGRSLLHDKKHQLVYVTPKGKIIPRSKWDASLLPGVTIETAFPFLGRRLTIDPVVRLRYADLLPQPTFAKTTRQAKAA